MKYGAKKCVHITLLILYNYYYDIYLYIYICIRKQVKTKIYIVFKHTKKNENKMHIIIEYLYTKIKNTNNIIKLTLV